MNDRRRFLVVLGAATVAPRIGFAQSKQPVLIGWLNIGSPESRGYLLTAFKEGLAALGWKEGFQIVIDERWADGQYDRTRSLAEELAAKKPALIVAAPLPLVAAAARAAPGTPIVIATGGDPVASGLVKSLARPAGLITGLSSIRLDLAGKYLELLLAAAPALKQVGFLADPNTGNYPRMMDVARRSVARYPVVARYADAGRPEEIEPAMSRLAKAGAQALIVMSGAMFGAERRRIVKLALAQRWPVIAGDREFAEEGALLAYGVDLSANYRRAAYYVDRILKGTRPGDLPIEQPTRIELVINLRTANALGLTLPQPFLMRADRVIE